jgi:hypothetical protein
MHKRRMAAYRLPPETIAQIEALAAELQRRSPGKVSRSDAIAWAVARAADELDRQGRGEAAAEVTPPPPEGNRAPPSGRPMALATGVPVPVVGSGGKLARDAEQAAQEIAKEAAEKAREAQRAGDMLRRREQFMMDEQMKRAARAVELTPPKPRSGGIVRLAEAPADQPDST